MLFLLRDTAVGSTAPSRLATVRKILDWSFSLAFAALLVAAIWKLDHAPSTRATPQAPPEGWALWSGDLPIRTAASVPQPASVRPEPAAR